MSFPLTREGVVISEVVLNTDGQRLLSFPSAQLASTLDGYISEEVSAWLQQTQSVTPEQLANQGVNLSLDMQTLEVAMSIESEANATQRLGIDSYDTSQVPYSKAAQWSWQNNINIAHQYNDRTSISESNIDINGGFNIGGVDGLNATYNLYVREAQSSEMYRGTSQLFYDNTRAPWRLSAGDVAPSTSGHLPNISLGGITFERAYSDIQPYRQLRNSGTQSLELIESAEVTVYLNDIRISRLRLPPGRYELDDLPLTDGSNDIRLEIIYASGTTETITYSQFYNGRLLKMGLDDFSIALGTDSFQADRSIEYSNDLIAMGFYEYGLNNRWTLGANGLLHKTGQLVGVSLVNGSDWGNVSVRASTSYQKEADLGYALSVDYSQQIFGSSAFGTPNLRLGFDDQRQFSAMPWKEDNNLDSKVFRANYQWYISSQWDASLYADYRRDTYSGTQYNTSLQVNWRNDMWRVGLNADYSRAKDDETTDEFLTYLTVEYFIDLFSSKHRFNASHNTQLRQSRIELAKSMESYVGDYGYELSTERNDGREQYFMRGEYTANRWRGQIEVDRQQSPATSTQFYGNLSSSFVVADKTFGWGRSNLGSIALFEVHPTLNDSTAMINVGSDQKPEIMATHYAANMVALPRNHEINTLTYQVPDAPLGYSLGAGITELKPGSMTTHIITIGSDATRTVIATAMSPDHSPIALYAGTAFDEHGNTLSIFTNSAGRFVLDGVAAGVYRLELGPWQGQLTIRDTDPILYYVDTLTLQPKENTDD